MRVLLAINSWRSDKARWLHRVLAAYAEHYADLDLRVLLSVNYAFDCAGVCKGLNLIRLPRRYEGWDYCWNARAAEFASDWDILIESDDDLVVPRAGLQYYVEAMHVLSRECIPGFLSVESDGRKDYLITMPKLFGQAAFAREPGWIEPCNVHSACFVIDRARWEQSPPSREPCRAAWMTRPEYARSEVYHRCYRKRVRVSAIHDGTALVHHLPNRYLIRTWLQYPPAEMFHMEHCGT
jgi:hypothetical protein